MVEFKEINHELTEDILINVIYTCLSKIPAEA